jgi:hypothetical protein
VLYSIWQSDGVAYKRVVVPRALVDTVLTMCHDDISGAHLGYKKTWGKIQRKFYWSTMYRDTKNWLSSCFVCAAKKRPSIPHRAPLLPITHVTKPFEMLGVDVLGPLPTTTSGRKYVVVFTDYLTKWTEAFANAVCKCRRRDNSQNNDKRNFRSSFSSTSPIVRSGDYIFIATGQRNMHIYENKKNKYNSLPSSNKRFG